jgi:RNA polymerase sigma-70 factor, ECF subfamily
MTTEPLLSEPARLAWRNAEWHRLTPSIHVWARQAIPRAMGLSADEIDDLVALTVVRAWTQAQVPADPPAWCRTVARNLAYDTGKRKRTQNVADVDLDALPSPMTADDLVAEMDRRQQVGRLRNALRRLPEDMRRCVVLFDLHGLDHATVAARLGITAATSRIRVCRGRKLLAALFLDETLPPLKDNGVPRTPTGPAKVRTWREFHHGIAVKRRAPVLAKTNDRRRSGPALLRYMGGV